MSQQSEAIHAAAISGNVAAAKAALDQGINGKAMQAACDDALQWAAHKGHTDIMRLLIDAGADLHSKQDYALTWAAESGQRGAPKPVRAIGYPV